MQKILNEDGETPFQEVNMESGLNIEFFFKEEEIKNFNVEYTVDPLVSILYLLLFLIFNVPYGYSESGSANLYPAPKHWTIL